MTGKLLASVLRASAREVVRTAREMVTEAQQARATAYERVREAKALSQHLHARRERDARDKKAEEGR